MTTNHDDGDHFIPRPFPIIPCLLGPPGPPPRPGPPRPRCPNEPATGDKISTLSLHTGVRHCRERHAVISQVRRACLREGRHQRYRDASLSLGLVSAKLSQGWKEGGRRGWSSHRGWVFTWTSVIPKLTNTWVKAG